MVGRAQGIGRAGEAPARAYLVAGRPSVHVIQSAGRQHASHRLRPSLPAGAFHGCVYTTPPALTTTHPHTPHPLRAVPAGPLLPRVRRPANHLGRGVPASCGGHGLQPAVGDTLLQPHASGGGQRKLDNAAARAGGAGGGASRRRAPCRELQRRQRHCRRSGRDGFPAARCPSVHELARLD